MGILRTALEGTDLEEDKKEVPTLVMRGPLSEIIYRALNIEYDKEREENEEALALESQAQDAVIFKSFLDGARGTDQGTPNIYTVYGVSKNEIQPETLVETKQAIDDQNLVEPSNMFLYVHADEKGNVSDTQLTSKRLLQEALESMVVEAGGRVFTRMEDLLACIAR